tara:strand:- start:226 stop:2748 length:2523 start_codon:yes stop_codon:yes gene_type:complete
MSSIRFNLIIVVFCSFLLTETIHYQIQNKNLSFIDSHFILNNANATKTIDDKIYDTYRLPFVANNKNEIKFKIKNIEWTKSNHKINDLDSSLLIFKGEKFNYKNCPSLFIDIFPYKLDKENNLFFLKNLEIDFIVDSIVVSDFCKFNKDIINKNLLIVNKSSSYINDIDYLVITNSELIPSTEALLSIHTDLNINVIDVEDIIFLYPDLDAEYAIREYLLLRINSEPNLNYLLLLGDETIIPPIYNGSTPSDDYYTSPGNLAANPQLSTGRITVNNINDAYSIFEKIDNYVNNLNNPISSNQSWRMNIGLISDDENNPNPNKYPELSHSENTNYLYEQMKENLVVNTFYGIEYTPTQSSEGLVHTELTADLLSAVNNGISLVNYIGHGNYYTLSDEKILVLERDINSINSSDYKLPIWVVGTCSFGQYDEKDSMAEALLLKENGAIAVISTTRGIGENSNINYLTKLFNKINSYLTDVDNKNRLGDIVRESKNNSASEYLFHLFGDPALPLPFPKVNNTLISNIPEALFIGSQNSFNTNGINGYLDVFNKEKLVSKNYSTGDTINYYTPGEKIYSGLFNNDICFSTSIDASECFDCASMRVHANAQNYIMNSFNLDILESDNLEEDVSGPVIMFKNKDYRNIYDNDIVFLNDYIVVNTEDESGINLMNGLGHNIRYWFNDEQSSQVIDSDLFISQDNCSNSSSGEFFINLKNLELGLNTLNVEIWDNFNNRTLESINILVENFSFKAFDVYNFPNPFSKKTSFTFKVSEPNTEANIIIFDLKGKKIKSILYNCSESFCVIPWDGKDMNGNHIDNGTYIYHLKIRKNNLTYKNLYKLTKIK